MRPPLSSLTLRLHHVGYAVQSIDAVAADYIRRFGYQPITPVLHDPLQTAYVQFLQLPGDSAFLEFVAPDAPDSKLTVSARRGGGLHHLCYTAPAFDIAIPSLEGEGLRLISDPQPAVAFACRRICWLFGDDNLPIELVERRHDLDLCTPGQ